MIPGNIKRSVTIFRQNIRHFRHYWVEPVFPIYRLLKAVSLYRRYIADWSRYSAMQNCEELRFSDSYPCLFDRTTTTAFDAHYFYQDLWALRRLHTSGSPYHVDVGSLATFVGLLTCNTRVISVDIRPLMAHLDNYDALSGSVLALPLRDSSVPSLSCLHVAEHVGLGRYGDALDPEGTKKAARELTRVLGVGGNLYFSVPVGKPRVCFNAHRVHPPRKILEYFTTLDLVEFSGIDDAGRFRERMEPGNLDNETYACGLFHFSKGNVGATS